MDIDTTSILGGEINKSQVPPIEQKRILAFVNHFILTTCTFLNNFALQCDNSFIEIERKLQKIEAALIIVEEKLSSIPGLETPKLIESLPDVLVDTEKVKENEMPAVEDKKDDNDESSEQTKAIVGIKASVDIRYKKYFKMLQFGVPPPAVKQKMESEGLNSSVLDTPDLILSDGIANEEMEP